MKNESAGDSCLHLKKKDEIDLFDPDFEVPHVREKKPPQLPGYLEHGLLKGKVFIRSTILIVPDDEKDDFKVLIPSPRTVASFLQENDLVVTSTDKNLGIAVSKCSWLEEKCLDLLADKNNYSEIHYLVMKQEMDHKCTKAEELAIKAENILPNSKQIGKFLRHLVTEVDKAHKLPIFYGIPKIYKKPTKMRPIIPCHSAVQNPAAKYVDKCLRPIVQSAPSIIHGSKDLAIKLSKLNINIKRKYFIITGDIVRRRSFKM